MASTASDSHFKIFCYANFNIYRSSRRKSVTSVFILNRILNICDELDLQVLLVIGVLKRFISPILTYTAQFEESVLHIRFVSHYFIEYMR